MTYIYSSVDAAFDSCAFQSDCQGHPSGLFDALGRLLGRLSPPDKQCPGIWDQRFCEIQTILEQVSDNDRLSACSSGSEQSDQSNRPRSAIVCANVVVSKCMTKTLTLSLTRSTMGLPGADRIVRFPQERPRAAHKAILPQMRPRLAICAATERDADATVSKFLNFAAIRIS